MGTFPAIPHTLYDFGDLYSKADITEMSTRFPDTHTTHIVHDHTDDSGYTTSMSGGGSKKTWPIGSTTSSAAAGAMVCE